MDDGSDSVADLVPDDPQIRYIRLPARMVLGEKRNFCVRESRGDLIMHWDDDDWMASWRISYQVQELLTHQAEVCGLRELYFRELEGDKCWLYKYPANAKPWLAGGSLLYTKAFFLRSPFPKVQVASDTQFIWSRKLDSAVVLPDCRFYVASVHGKNTSPKRTNSSYWHPIDKQEIRDLMEEKKGRLPLQIKNGENHKLWATRHNGNAIGSKATACLLSFKRPGNMQAIVDSLSRYDYIDEILVWNNNPNYRLSLNGAKVRVIHSPENVMCYGRFLCIKEARNQIIYVQDDDVLVKNVDVLYQEFLKDSTRIVHGLASKHYHQRHIYSHFYGQSALIGWGAFFKKNWTEVLDNYLSENQEDFLFLREADQFFTILTQHKHDPLPADFKPLDHERTKGVALYLDPKHYLYKSLAASKALRYNRKQKKHAFPVTWNVVIPCKNYGQYLADAIESVLLNTADYVITIVDDHSKDGTEVIAREYIKAYPFINYIRLEETKDVGYARNRGVAAVDSVFVVLLDADDKIGADYLFRAEALLRQGCDVANPDAILFGEKSARWVVPDMVTLSMLLTRNHVHTCAAFRRSYWAQIGGMDESLRNWQDYEFWIRLAEAGARIKRLDGDHFFYRKHGVSKSSATLMNRQTLQEHIRDKHKHLYLTT